MILSRIQQAAIIGAGIVIAALAIFATIQTFRLNSTQRALKDEREIVTRMNAESAAANGRYRSLEQRHLQDTQRIEKDKADEIADMRADRDAALAELRTRPRRPAATATQSAAAPQDGPGCTGAALFADDAAFLVGEAARADEIRTEVKACYAQYDSLAQALDTGR
ncbi:MAG: hypothetical protein EPO45_19235 [Sphingobium sp.]|nr:MAG: hypothetical protein EPO45_19235 [Sphingobium sp.]